MKVWAYFLRQMLNVMTIFLIPSFPLITHLNLLCMNLSSSFLKLLPFQPTFLSLSLSLSLSLTLLSGSLDEPWEVLATQPFCPRESEASETQPIATHIEAHGPCPSPPTAAPQEQHPQSPVHAESLGIQGRGMQTVEEDMGTPRETAERVTPERGPLERETEKLPSEGEREDVMLE